MFSVESGWDCIAHFLSQGVTDYIIKKEGDYYLKAKTA